MNIELRTYILNCSLQIEDGLSKILSFILKFPKEDSRTLGSKSTSLSLKTKVDLLFDIGRITKDEYSKFITFMEIRNQFIHNIDAYSFTIVLARIEKENQLKKINSELEKKFLNRNTPEQVESLYKLCFNELINDLNNVLLRILECIISEINEDEKLKSEQLSQKLEHQFIKYFTESFDEFTSELTAHLPKEDAERITLTFRNHVFFKTINKMKLFDKE